MRSGDDTYPDPRNPPLPWRYDDGGRLAAGFRGETGDCGVRAVAIVTGADYRSVYDALGRMAGKSVRNGIDHDIVRRYLVAHGFSWRPCMGRGTGCRVHVARGEIPETGPILLRLSGHFAAVVDGILRDTYDCSRDGTRCVYGYYHREGK